MQSLISNLVSKIVIGIVMSIAGAVQAKYGFTLDAAPIATDLGALIASLAVWWWSHHSILADVTGYTAGESNPNPPKGASGLTNRVVLALLVPVFAFGLLTAGCSGFNQNTHRAVAVSAKGIAAGITEDPSTGLYELGLKNVDSSAIMLPIFYQTNAAGDISVVVPDAVMSSEQGGKAHLFGSGSTTVTIAIGPNAVASILGAAHYPINAPYWTNSAVGLLSPAAGLPTTTSTTQTVSNGVTSIVTQASSPFPATQVVNTNGASNTVAGTATGK